MVSVWRPLVSPWVLLVVFAPAELYVDLGLRAGPVFGGMVGVTVLQGIFCVTAGQKTWTPSTQHLVDRSRGV